MKYKYKELNVEPYLDEIESGYTDKMESHIIAEINDTDFDWQDKDEIDEDGLYVEDVDNYLYKIVYYGQVVFEIY